MKNTVKTAFCGILAALALIIMLAAYFPYLTYALPAIAGCVTVPIVIEASRKHAVAVYAIVSLLSFFICEKEAMVFYIFIFGWYPIAKSLIELIKNKPLQWAVKLVCATAGFAAAYFSSIFVFGIDVESLGDFGKYTSLIMLAAYDIVFVVYDIAVSRLVWLYFAKFRKHIRKLIG